MILNLFEELTGKYLIGAIPQGISSTQCKFHSRFGGAPTAYSRPIICSCRTDNWTQIRYKTYTNRCVPDNER